MLISNEMRNEPALALRLINGKITPSSSLMKQYTAVYFQTVLSSPIEKKKSPLINNKKKLAKLYFFSKPGYSSDLCIYSLMPYAYFFELTGQTIKNQVGINTHTISETCLFFSPLHMCSYLFSCIKEHDFSLRCKTALIFL